MGARVRLVPSWHRLLLFTAPPLVAGAALVAVLVGVPERHPPTPAVEPGVPAALAPAPGLLVDVTGAVLHPGV